MTELRVGVKEAKNIVEKRDRSEVRRILKRIPELVVLVRIELVMTQEVAEEEVEVMRQRGLEW